MLSMAIQKRLNNLGDNEPSFKMHTLRRNAKKGVAATPRELVDCSEEDIANQLTLMEFAIYSSIQVRMSLFIIITINIITFFFFFI